MDVSVEEYRRRRDLWLAALRSGKYKQEQSYLSVNGGYCCLGVACRVYEEDGGELTTETVEEGDDLTILFNGEQHYCPTAVQDWLGLQSYDGSYYTRDDEFDDFALISLSEKNDDGASFAEIADTIESEPIGLFRWGVQLSDMKGRR